MLWLSELMMQRHDLENFEGLVMAIEKKAQQGERFFSMDVKPPYPDTPDNWEERLEAIFTSVRS
ncbi:MAG TPA: sulfur relay protein DsrC [Gammaproteobacteria bacterium]|nr:sulfur relay protein DsrC [Gammaproteobacteria bacterium]